MSSKSCTVNLADKEFRANKKLQGYRRAQLKLKASNLIGNIRIPVTVTLTVPIQCLKYCHTVNNLLALE
jgi:hypothetical protein